MLDVGPLGLCGASAPDPLCQQPSHRQRLREPGPGGGRQPMMACAPQEMAEITAAASATVLNTGTPDEERFEVLQALRL